MTLVFLQGVDPQKDNQTFYIGGQTLEACLEALNQMVTRGWQLIYIELVEDQQKTILPVDVFDGSSFTEPFRQLQREWQALLA